MILETRNNSLHTGIDTYAPGEFAPGKHIVNNFVTRIWEHPLLTELTRKKRSAAFSAADQLTHGESGILLIPVGGCVWALNPESDVDFVMLHSPNADVEKIKQIRTEMDESRKKDSFNPDKSILHFADKRELGNTYNFQNDFRKGISNLFLTPDEYIFGDHKMLTQIRLKALDKMNYEDSEYLFPNFPLNFSVVLTNELTRIKEWPVRHFTNPFKNNFLRYMDLLLDRSAYTHKPKSWITAFQTAIAELRPPVFGDIKKALNASGGTIKLEEGYRAQGLKVENT